MGVVRVRVWYAERAHLMPVGELGVLLGEIELSVLGVFGFFVVFLPLRCCSCDCYRRLYGGFVHTECAVVSFCSVPRGVLILLPRDTRVPAGCAVVQREVVPFCPCG